MNRAHTAFHLKEALEELQRTAASVESDLDYGDLEFSLAMEHIYHHLNTAWNARGASDQRARECTQEDFEAWRRFPSDLLSGALDA